MTGVEPSLPTSGQTTVWTVYIIRSDSGKLYTGITTDMERRFRQHASGKGARFFRTSEPLEVVYREQVPNRSVATRRELAIKGMTRARKLKLIESQGLAQRG